MEFGGRQLAKGHAVVKLFLFIVAIIAIGFCAANLIESFGYLLELRWWNHPWILLVHLLLLSLVFFTFAAAWAMALKVGGQSFSFAGATHCWFVANAGKYVPGKVFMFAGRLSLCAKIGVRQSACFWALALEHFFLLLATLPFLVPLLLHGFMPNTVFIYTFCSILLVAIVLTIKPGLLFTLINRVLVRMQRKPLPAVPSSTNMLLLLGIYFFAWTLYGLSGVILTGVLEIQTAPSALVIASVFVVSWVVGFLSILTPGGIGVREATLILLLQPSMAAPQALALALLARATWTIIEIAGVGIGLWLGKGWVGNGKKVC